MDRRSLFEDNNQKEKISCISFVSTFGPESGKIADILRKHWGILQRGCPQIDEFKEPELMSYRRPPSLKDKLVRSDVRNDRKSVWSHFGPPKMWNFPYLGCLSCNYMIRDDVLRQG